jgi:hypothetical protein
MSPVLLPLFLLPLKPPALLGDAVSSVVAVAAVSCGAAFDRSHGRKPVVDEKNICFFFFFFLAPQGRQNCRKKA